ncbi:MAG: iron ABC transporter permease [Planctomycetes bacterium]|nr:iron ABC transporter permease [Planctomycetota bacterium]
MIRFRSKGWAWIALSAALLIGVAARLLIGRDPSTGNWLFGVPEPGIISLRLGAVKSGMAAGAALGLSGLLLQALLRNPLASPFILGLSAGAGLGATIAAWLPFAAAGTAAMFLGPDALLPGTIGAVGVLFVVFVLGRRGGVLDPLTLVLAGTVVASMCGAITLLLQSMMPPTSRGELWSWFMGQVPELPRAIPWWNTVVILVLVLLMALWKSRNLDLASAGDEEAESLGVAVAPLRIQMFVGAGALAAASVALCGPVAFIGFMAPHLARALLGGLHGALVPASAVAGAAILVWSDAIRQGIDFGSGRLPIGVLTALVGGPVFLLMLRSARLRRGDWSC